MSEAYVEYAEALFMLACEEKKEQEFYNSLSKVCKYLKDEPDYLQFLASPYISKGERCSAIDEAFGEALPEYVLSFIKLLCENGRIKEIFRSLSEFEKLYRAQQKKVKADIITASPLTPDEKDKLIKKLEKICKSSVTPEYCIDKTILGGVIVKMDDKLYDGSLKNRLKEVKEVMDS